MNAALPHSVEIEQSLIGAAMLNVAALDTSLALASASDFYDPLHAKLWEAMASARSSGRAVDHKLVAATIGASAEIAAGINIGTYLGRLVEEAPTTINAPDYARHVRDLADRRKIIIAAQTAISCANQPSDVGAGSIAAETIASLDSIATASNDKTVQRINLGEAITEAIDDCDDIAEGRRPAIDVTWGLHSLNRKTNGLDRGTLTVIGGRPSMGKTSIGLAIAMEQASAGLGVYFVSLEMTGKQLGARALSWIAMKRHNTTIVYSDIRAGNVDRYQREMLHNCSADIRNFPLQVEQEASLTLSQIASRARTLKSRMENQGTPLSVVIVDHIGIMRASERYSGNRVQEITEITGGLKALAKELNVAVIALSQLNRQAEGREDKRPVLGDFRDSGSIEQDADIMIGLYRESYYLDRKQGLSDEEVARMLDSQHVIEVIVLKQRQGEIGPVRLFCSMGCNFIGELQQ